MAVVLEGLGASCARLWRRRSYGSSAAAAVRKKGRGEANGGVGRLGHMLASIQFVSRDMPSLTTSFDIHLTAKPLLQFVNDLNDFRSPKYQLQMLFNHLVLIHNRN